MERTRAISTSFYKTYKYISALVITCLFVLFIVTRMLDGSIFGVVFGLLYCALVIGYWFPSFIKSMKQMKNLSYDEENLYVVENGIEEQIPFWQIRDVEIVSLNGIYRFNFFDKNLHGGAVSCKTSMWYPFNFKKVDRELNRVRALIRKAHAEYREQIRNENRLASHT